MIKEKMRKFLLIDELEIEEDLVERILQMYRYKNLLIKEE